MTGASEGLSVYSLNQGASSILLTLKYGLHLHSAATTAEHQRRALSLSGRRPTTLPLEPARASSPGALTWVKVDQITGTDGPARSLPPVASRLCFFALIMPEVALRKTHHDFD